MDRTGFVEYRSLKLLQQSHYHLLQFYTEVKLENVRNCLTQELCFDRENRRMLSHTVWMNKYTHLKNQLLGTRMERWGVEAGIGIRGCIFPEKGLSTKQN